MEGITLYEIAQRDGSFRMRTYGIDWGIVRGWRSGKIRLPACPSQSKKQIAHEKEKLLANALLGDKK